MIQNKQHPLRRVLNALYCFAGFLSALCIFALCGLILAQMVARQFDHHIPSSGDFIGFFVSWSAFLGLAYAMYYQSHIRVELFLSRLETKVRRYFEIGTATVATLLVGMMVYFCFQLVAESFSYQDVTDGEIPMSLGMVQLPMLIGLILFAISLADYAFCMLFKIQYDTPFAEELSE